MTFMRLLLASMILVVVFVAAHLWYIPHTGSDGFSSPEVSGTYVDSFIRFDPDGTKFTVTPSNGETKLVEMSYAFTTLIFGERYFYLAEVKVID